MHRTAHIQALLLFSLVAAPWACRSSGGKAYGEKVKTVRREVQLLHGQLAQLMGIEFDRRVYEGETPERQREMRRDYVLQKEAVMADAAATLARFQAALAAYRASVEGHEEVAVKSHGFLVQLGEQIPPALAAWEAWRSQRADTDGEAALQDQAAFQRTNSAFKQLLFVGDKTLDEVKALVESDVEYLDKD